MFNIPKIYRKLDLAEYAEELSGQAISVWVNPPKQKLIDLQEHAEDPDYNLEWLAEMWSTPKEQFTADAVRQFFNDCMDTDPALWSFVVEGTVRLIAKHREIERKN